MGVVPPGRRTAGPVFLDDSRQSAQGVIGPSRTRKCGGYVWLKHHHHAARGVARRIFVGPRATEVVLRKDLVEYPTRPTSRPLLFPLFIFSPFPRHRWPSADDANCFPALREHDGKQALLPRKPQQDEPFLTLRVSRIARDAAKLDPQRRSPPLRTPLRASRDCSPPSADPIRISAPLVIIPSRVKNSKALQ